MNDESQSQSFIIQSLCFVRHEALPFDIPFYTHVPIQVKLQNTL